MFARSWSLAIGATAENCTLHSSSAANLCLLIRPFLPHLLRVANSQLSAVPHQRHPEQQRLRHQLVAPALRAQLGRAEAEIAEAGGGAVDQCLDPELLDEGVQPPRRRGPLD